MHPNPLSTNERMAPTKTELVGRYICDVDLETILKLVVELREQTNSRKSFEDAARIIALIAPEKLVPQS